MEKFKMGKYKWNEFGKIKSFDDLTEYMQNKEYGHGGYYHYTTLENIGKILDSNNFWLSNVGGFNDLKDSEVFGDNKDQYFSLCFSTGLNENLPLWYMYSGVQGDGGRIRLTESLIKKLVACAKDELYILNTENAEKKIQISKDKYEVIFKDVLYYLPQEYNSSYVDLKYNTNVNHIFSKEDFEKYKNENIGFYKSIIWYYEKETRLLVKVDRDVLKKFKGYDSLNTKVVLKLSDEIRKNIKIDLAPEVTDVEEVTKRFDSLHKFVYGSSRVQLSKYQGQIQMNICKNCEYKKKQIDICQNCEYKSKN